MAWEKRGNGTYRYRSVRRADGTIGKVYLGRGRKAKLADKQDAEARAARAVDAAAMQRVEGELEPLDRLSERLDDQVDILMESTLRAAGLHLHHGLWRRSRYGTN